MKIIRASAKYLSGIQKAMKVLHTREYPFSSEKWILRLILEQQFYLAIFNEKVVGAVAFDFSHGVCKINVLAIQPSYQRKGIGKKLIKFVEGKCRTRKIKKLWLVSQTEYRAKGFYKKMGFKQEGFLKKQWHGKDCYIFGKILN